jgi:hypothetical protein
MDCHHKEHELLFIPGRRALRELRGDGAGLSLANDSRKSLSNKKI